MSDETKIHKNKSLTKKKTGLSPSSNSKKFANWNSKAQKKRITNPKIELKKQPVSKNVIISNKVLQEEIMLKEEKEAMKLKLLGIEDKIKNTKVRKKEVLDRVKQDVAVFKANLLVQKKLDKKNEEHKYKNLLLKKSNISDFNKEIKEQIKLHKNQSKIEAAKVKENIIESRRKLKEEKRKSKISLRSKKLEQKEKKRLSRSNQKIKKQELKEKLSKEKLKHKQQLINKKLELSIEVEQHKKEIQEKLFSQKNRSRSEMDKFKQETSVLQQQREQLKTQSSLLKLKSKIKKEEITHQSTLNSASSKKQRKSIKIETTHKVNSIKETGKQKLARGAILPSVSHNDATVEFVINHDNHVVTPSKSIPTKSKEDIVTFVSAWKNFDKKGEKLLSIVKEGISSKEVKKANKQEYFKTSMENYLSLVDNHNLVNFKSILRNAYLMAEEDLDEVIIDNVYNSIVKAILLSLRVKIGNYYIVPSKVSGKRTFVIVQELVLGEKVFDVSPLMSKRVARGIAKIVDYKLRNGNAIMILDGLAIENVDGDLQTAINANILRVG